MELAAYPCAPTTGFSSGRLYAGVVLHARRRTDETCALSCPAPEPSRYI